MNFATYYEVIHHPLAQARTLKDIKDYSWPSIDWLAVDHIPQAVKEINRDEPRAVFSHR